MIIVVFDIRRRFSLKLINLHFVDGRALHPTNYNVTYSTLSKPVSFSLSNRLMICCGNINRFLYTIISRNQRIEIGLGSRQCEWWRNRAITGKTLEYTLYWLDTQYEKDKRKAAPGGCFLCGRVCQFKLSVGFTPIIATHLFCRIK